MQRAFRVDNMKIIGDPHLWRAFVNNVPLHRRGHREQMLREIFVRELAPDGASVHICVGDLFDKPIVPLETIWFAAQAYSNAAYFNPDCQFYVLAGNHDLSRDQTKVSAFDVFARMVRTQENVHAVRVPTPIKNGVVLFPWSPLHEAGSLIEAWDGQCPVGTVFGHYDLDGNGSNLIPMAALKELGVKRLFNGHVHLPRVEVRDGIEIINVGSLMPFAHGEDHGEIYVTMTLDEVKRCLES